MKIAILTVHGGKNFGSYWQARALYDYLAGLGHDVFLYDSKTRNLRPLLVYSLKAAARLQFKKSLFNLKLYSLFKKDHKAVKMISSKKQLAGFDLMFYGSDEIWNVRREDMRSHPEFWGVGFDNIKKIAYAPSINYATAKDLLECGVKEALADFSAVSVRDSHSAEEIRKIYDGKVYEVLDPTFLHDRSYYEKIPYKPVDFKRYIGIYYFNLSDAVVETLRRFADSKGMKLVCIGSYNSRVDACVASENAFCYFLNADYIITNTFHGTAFSINFGKQFIACNPSKVTKISSLLERFDLVEREVSALSEEILTKLFINKPVDTDALASKVEAARKQSRIFIDTTLKTP
jgi:polysaccharide pyruvyl transferase WcaK-like protein